MKNNRECNTRKNEKLKKKSQITFNLETNETYCDGVNIREEAEKSIYIVYGEENMYV